MIKQTTPSRIAASCGAVYSLDVRRLISPGAAIGRAPRVLCCALAVLAVLLLNSRERKDIVPVRSSKPNAQSYKNNGQRPNRPFVPESSRELRAIGADEPERLRAQATVMKRLLPLLRFTSTY